MEAKWLVMVLVVADDTVKIAHRSSHPSETEALKVIGEVMAAGVPGYPWERVRIEIHRVGEG